MALLGWLCSMSLRPGGVPGPMSPLVDPAPCHPGAWSTRQTHNLLTHNGATRCACIPPPPPPPSEQLQAQERRRGAGPIGPLRRLPSPRTHTGWAAFPSYRGVSGQSGRPCGRTDGIASPSHVAQVRKCGPWASGGGLAPPPPTLKSAHIRTTANPRNRSRASEATRERDRETPVQRQCFPYVERALGREASQYHP